MYEKFPGSHLFAKRQQEKIDFTLHELCLGNLLKGKRSSEQTLSLCSNNIFSCLVCQAFISVSEKLTSNKNFSMGSSNIHLLKTLGSFFVKEKNFSAYFTFLMRKGEGVIEVVYKRRGSFFMLFEGLGNFFWKSFEKNTFVDTRL